MKDKSQNKSIPPDEYTRDYYLTCCEGHEVYINYKGRILPLRLTIPLELARVRKGMTVIDIGCGRGEVIHYCAATGARAWGIDYARSAVELSKEILQGISDIEILNNIGIQQANAITLPFDSGSSDVIFMLDFVEHLLPEELNKALNEAWRVLKPGGKLIIHTMPNLWYYKFGYPLFRLVQSLRGEHLPKNPRERWSYSHVHVNEQNPSKLKTTLRANNFDPQVWLKSTVNYDYENNPLIRKSMKLLTVYFPFKLIFCNDIFAIAEKV